MLTIPQDINSNLWNLNPHLIYLKPFSKLYEFDKDSKYLWCIIWLTHPDEDENKYYALPDNEKLDVCKEYNPEFDLDNPVVIECIDKFPELCLSAIQQAYKDSKDQLLRISKFLNTQELTLETAETLIKLKAQMPKIIKEFLEIEKQFQKSKSDQRVLGGRQKTTREKDKLKPEQ